MRPVGYAVAILAVSVLAGLILRSQEVSTAVQPMPRSATVELQPQVLPCLSLQQLSTKMVPAPKLPSSLQGRVGLFVARFESDQAEFNPSKVVYRLGDSLFPLASNYKTAVLLEVLRKASAGGLNLTERFVITQANQSLGAYPYDNTPIPDLALRMIQWSDNTATDILHRRVGLGSLQPLADQLKLCQTRLLLTTKAWWTAQAGFGGADFPKDALLNSTRRFAAAQPEVRLEIATRLDAIAQRYRPDTISRTLDRYFEKTTDWVRSAQIDRNLQNASTPMEWARYLWYGFTENTLSASANLEFRRIMAKGFGPRLLKAKHSYAGGKSGNTAGVLGFSGFLEAEDGARYVYVLLADEIPAIYTLDRYRAAFRVINESLALLGAK